MVPSVAPIARGIRRVVHGSRAARLADRVAPAALLVWAAGNVLAEPLAQAGAYALLLVALSRLRGASIPRDVRRFAVVAFLFAARRPQARARMASPPQAATALVGAPQVSR